MDLPTIVELVIGALALGGIGIWVARTIRNSRIKAGKKAQIASDTKGDVLQSDKGSVSKTQHIHVGPTIVMYWDPGTALAPGEKAKVKKTFQEVAEKHMAPRNVIDHSGVVADTSTGTLATLSKAIPYISGLIAEATGSADNEIAEEIVRLADLENYIQVGGGVAMPQMSSHQFRRRSFLPFLRH